MYDLNRSVLFVLPKEPYLEWARKDPAMSFLTLEKLRDEGTAYLIEDSDVVHGREKLLRRHWRSIFEQELEAWTSRRSEWPKKRTLQMFEEWFDVFYSSMCLDTLNIPLEDK